VLHTDLSDATQYRDAYAMLGPSHPLHTQTQKGAVYGDVDTPLYKPRDSARPALRTTVRITISFCCDADLCVRPFCFTHTVHSAKCIRFELWSYSSNSQRIPGLSPYG
jgi:hypothetical protein